MKGGDERGYEVKAKGLIENYFLKEGEPCQGS